MAKSAVLMKINWHLRLWDQGYRQQPEGSPLRLMLRSDSVSRSSVALDNLRAFVILIVLAFHSALAYL
jgi:hypothetical protein